MLKAVPHVGLAPSFDETARTEDIKFSPSGRVLAVVATTRSIAVFAIDTGARPIQISRHAILKSSSFSSPHGIDFLSDDVIVVANRAGWVTFYRVPPVEAWQEQVTIEPIHEMGSVWFGRKGAKRETAERRINCGPGSVRVHGKNLFVCCNNANTVTVHPYEIAEGRIATGDGTVIPQAGLEIPDGVALTRDGHWMAVSNHKQHCVMITRRSDGTLAGVLRDDDLRYPHGLCFDPVGGSLYVADAGESHVHVFMSGGDWQSANGSTFKLPAVDVDAFRKTREAVPEELRALEGGIKGIDIDPSGRVLATTCRHQTLRFFEILR
jgi:6-phosphogluconolactonase (cycloisomerase 2 family)